MTVVLELFLFLVLGFFALAALTIVGAVLYLLLVLVVSIFS